MKTVLISIALVVICMMQYGEAAITAWTTPTISGAASGTGTLSVAEDQLLDTTITTYVAESGANLGDYTLVTAVAPFALSTAGALTITAALDYETTTTYTLEIKAIDDADPVGSGTATITVTVTNVYDVAPVFAITQNAATVPDASTAGTAVKTVTATDSESGDTITYSITDGDTNSHFTIGASTGTITVESGITLSASTLAGYELEVTATDSGSNTATTKVWIAVLTCSSGSVLVVASLITLLAALLTTML